MRFSQFIKHRLTFLFFIVTLVIFIILSISVSFISRRHLLNQQIEYGVAMTELLSRKVIAEIEQNHIADQMLVDHMIYVGNYLLANESDIDNDYLAFIASTFEVHEIIYYSNEGMILYDANDTWVGWQAQEGDPIHNFMVSGEDLYVEEVRESTESENQFKFIYIRSQNTGNFLQLGYPAEYYYELTERVTLQRIVNDIAKASLEDGILYALIVDTNFVAIADSDLEDLNADYTDDYYYERVMQGETLAFDWYYPQIGRTVLEVATPLIYQDEIIGLVAIGFSYDRTNQILISQFTTIMIITGTFLFGLFFVYRRYVLNPIGGLRRTIDELNESKTIDLNQVKSNDYLYPVYQSINSFIEKVHESNLNNQRLIDEIHALAHEDYLTKMPNRLYFMDNIHKITSNYQTTAIFFLDFDGFKEFNDDKGHVFGDALLRRAGEMINQLFSKNTIISRFGGDEFLIAFGYNEIEELEEFMIDITSIFDGPIEINDGLYYIKTSIGASLYPNDTKDIEEAIRMADVAMYKSKNHHIPIVYYNPLMDQENRTLLDIQKILEIAIANDGFELVYQPQVDINTNEIIAYEALLRLKNKAYPPATFIDVAETSGQIIKIGRIVIEKMIQQLASWDEQGFTYNTVFFNFSSLQLQDQHFIAHLRNLINMNHIKEGSIGLEITESALINDEEDLKVLLTQLKALGIKIAIDDFGSGHTGLYDLTQYRIDLVKLDKRFIDQNLTETKISVFKALIDFIETIKLDVIIEGIETKEQVNLLKTLNAKFVQGYYYHKPMSANQIQKKVKK